jgi:hypothetical protein
MEQRKLHDGDIPEKAAARGCNDLDEVFYRVAMPNIYANSFMCPLLIMVN